MPSHQFAERLHVAISGELLQVGAQVADVAQVAAKLEAACQTYRLCRELDGLARLALLADTRPRLGNVNHSWKQVQAIKKPVISARSRRTIGAPAAE